MGGILTGCVGGINLYNANQYADAANAATRRGDWDGARRLWARVVVNADLGHAAKKRRALFYYEYGRATGVTCFFDLSEEYLNKAYELDRETAGPVYMSLLELARLNSDQKKYAQAIGYFERAIPELERVNAQMEAPIEYANILDEYSIVLSVVDRDADAAAAKSRAAMLRANNKGRYSISDRTPYGTQCSAIKK